MRIRAGQEKRGAREKTSEPDGIMPDQRKPGVLAARLLIGLIVLICAEVFSGASLQIGLW
jgi:hypothetical protein